MKKDVFKKMMVFTICLLSYLGVWSQTMPVISTEGNDVWYYIQFKNGLGVMQDMGNNTNILTKAAVKDLADQQWKVTGTTDNYVFTSKAGRKINFSTTASRFQTSSTTNSTFKFKATTNSTYTPGWELQRVGSTQYINQFGGAGLEKQLGEWSFADPNNPLKFVLPSEMGFKPEKPTTEATITGSAAAPASKLSLWYRTPATDWMTQALPIGNGQFGGMIFGGIKQEEIQFNDKTLWDGNTTTYGSYQNFGSLLINSVGITAVSNYIRYLDIENALGGVEYDVNGVHYTREYFTSNPDSSIIVRYSASQAQKLNLEVMLWDAHGKGSVYNRDVVTIQGKLSLISYFAKVQVKNEGGTITALPNGGISIQNADAVTIILAGKTNFSTTSPTYIHDAARVPVEVESIVSKAIVKDYATLKSTHITDYKSLYDRVSLRIGTTSNAVPTNQLITKYAADKDNLLNELYFQYGRYLMISSARGIALPSNLQGIWNNSNTPPWSSDIHSNINVQENYWPAEVTNLSELHTTFLDYIYRESQQRTQWKQNAKDSGQTKGWTLYTENNIFGWHGGFMHNYVIANAWYAMHSWQHYRYTMDKDYLLNNAYPIMKSCAEYWMERLINDKGNSTYGFAPDGTLVCPNEYSPEHGPSEDGVAHAQQLVWDLFKNTLEAMDALGTSVAGDAAFRVNLEAKFAKLDNGCHTEKDGGKYFLREWKYTTRSTVGDYSHRHISHLVGLYPGNQISPLINDSIFKAAVVALDSRGDYSTGWAMGHRITCWARALDGNRAYRILNNALALSSGSGGIYTNLFDAHPPFQIDGNFAATAAIAELLIQSHIEGIIQLLPALPDAWTEGQVKGLRATGNFTVDINWANNLLTTARVISVAGQVCKMNFPLAKNATIINSITNEPVNITVIDNNTISFPTTVNGQYKVTPGPACDLPVFSPAGGKYGDPQHVEITTATEGATIYYTTDGTNPGNTSTIYSSAILVSDPITIKAIALKEGFAESKISTASYEIGYTIPVQNRVVGADRYLTKVSTDGGVTNLDYSVTSAPNSNYNFYNTTKITASQGKSFTLNISAYPGQADGFQFCQAIILVDWNKDYDFADPGERIAIIGARSQDNTATVMNVVQNIAVPATAVEGKTRLRLIYTDAWRPTSYNDLGDDPTDKGRCYDFDLIVNNATSVKYAMVDMLTVSPNPTNGDLNVNFPEGGQYELNICNLDGRTIESKSIKMNGSGVYALNLSSYGASTYLLRVRFDSKFEKTLKVVKM